MLFTFVVFILVFRQVSTQDECHTSMTIPNAGQRYYNYHVTEVIVHDFFLKQGWYRAGNEIMPTEKPSSLYVCGTQFPIWMNGAHPTVQNGIVDRVACAINAQSSCAIEYDIKVKNCGTFSVYFLTSTASRQEAYCFGIGTGGESPTFVPPPPTVFPIEVVKQAMHVYSRVHFVCKFESSNHDSDKDLHYQVFWYAKKDGSEVMFIMPEQPKDNIDDLQLTEEIFMNEMKQTLGVEISCAVLPLSGKQGMPGKISPRSGPFYAGVHVTVIRSKIIRGDNANPGKASLTSTIPVGCEGPFGCSRAILAFVPDMCNGPSFQSYCGTSIFSARWNSSVYINVVAGNDAAYALKGNFDIYLRTEGHTPPNPARIWDNYYLPKFSVEIVPSAFTVFPGKICYSYNDPHMRTFDGRFFENHITGEYILYRHLNFTTEIQIKTSACSPSSTVRCNCGVAVKAGMDVFVVDVCGTLPFIGYKENLCVDSTLDVRKTGDIYTIYFPYGTYVVVSLQSPNPRFLNVHVIPSIHDQNMSSTGLCGALSGVCTDDFRKRDGTFLQNVNGNCETNRMLEPRDVMDEWRVWTNESLFDLTKEVKDNLKPWITYVCSCDNNNRSTVNTSIPCGGQTTQKCNFGKKVGTKTCQILRQRKRRSVPTRERFPSPQQRAKRSVVSQLSEHINMTEEEAQTYCQNYMKQSPIFDLCTNVPSTRSDENINNCAMDILLTKTTLWSDSARESMREQCLNEISRNNTFREDEEAIATVAEIVGKACPSMCSNRGQCINGTCICDSGYGSSDCSLDLSQPPEIFGLLDDGLCDERHVECNQAFVYGEIFAEGENLICRIMPFIMSLDGNRKYETTFYVPAEHETLFEVICPVQQTRWSKNTYAKYTEAQDRFVIGYTISVSNDGQRYGRDFDLHMYNSECQLSQNGSERFTFSLMDGYCFIDHKCVSNGQVHKEDECLICDDKQLKFDWSARENHKACRNEPDPTPSPALTTIMPKGSSQPIVINLALFVLSFLISEMKTI